MSQGNDGFQDKPSNNEAGPEEEVLAEVVCPGCRGSDWLVHDVSYYSSQAVGKLRVHPEPGHELQPDTWVELDVAECLAYAWECSGCGEIYAHHDLVEWATQQGPRPQPTTYEKAEFQWLCGRLSRLIPAVT